MKSFSGLVWILATLTVTVPSAFAADAVDLGTLGGSSSAASAVVFGGSKIAGSSEITADAASHAFLKNGKTLIDLGVLPGGVNSYGAAVNLLGQVGGVSEVVDPNLGFGTHAFLYTSGKMKDLGTLGGYSSTGAGIDLLGQVVGSSLLGDDATTHAFLYNGKTLVDLGTLPGGNNSFADGINTVGTLVAGQSENGQFDLDGTPIADATLWDLTKKPIKVNDIGSLGGNLTRAIAVNDFGVAAGSGVTAAGNVDGFIYAGGKISDIGSLGGSYTTALAVNDLNVVVGFSNLTGDSDTHAFVWTSKTGIVDLNKLLPTNTKWQELNAAYGVSIDGVVVGVGIINGESHAFALTLCK